jgi:cytochrome c peroxidase
MYNGAFTNLTDAVIHHLDVFASARAYTPASQGLPADLVGPIGPIEPVLDRVDPILAAPIQLTPAEICQLVAFMANGLLDPRAEPDNLRKLVPKSVPSGRPVLTFEFPAARPPIVCDQPLD